MNSTSKNIFWVLGGVGILLLVGYGLRYAGVFHTALAPGLSEVEGLGALSKAVSEARNVPLVVEAVVSGLEVPWSVVFTADNRMLVTARPGRLYQVIDEKLDSTPLAEFPEAVSEGEEGLMGLALDPEYVANRLLYISLAYEKNGKKTLKVMRFRDEGKSLVEGVTLIDSIPAATYHAGSRLKFGPDGKLYITTGDATEKNLAQDLESTAGKILRLNSDGSIPEDNPFSGSPIYSYGHRNPQGIAWHPITEEFYQTEHGPSLFDGPAGGDEVNQIVKGGNYGWPLVSHDKAQEGMKAPLLVFTPAVAPASATFYGADKIPQFQNQFFFGALKGEGIIRVKLDENNSNKVVEHEKIPEVKVGRVRDVLEGPDGALYFTTSNRDGRGTPRPGDDKIYRLRAK